MKNFIISVDGPAGSGKQSIAKYIKNKYKFFHLDSGLLYRRLTFIIVKNKIDIKNTKKINNLIKSIKYLSTSNNKNLRTESISKLTSRIATDDKIRNFINKQQRKIIKEKMQCFKGCVVDGRDIGSNVFKNAKIKLYIEVKPEIRAKRRHKQLIEVGEKSIYCKILKEINLRDRTDKNRNIAPLIIPKGAFIVDNSDIFRKTIKCINQIIKKNI